jgi:hypothetical protein
MYCPLMNRFRGAFLGSAAAEMLARTGSESSFPLSLTQSLIQNSRAINSLLFYADTGANRRGLPPSAVETLTHVVLISLILHDAPHERLDAIHNLPVSCGSLFLSEALVLRLFPQPVTIKALQQNLKTLKCEDSTVALLATLEGLITQRVTLPQAIQAIAVFPDLSVLDQAIALSLYCWLCTPQQFGIGVRRSHQAWQYLPQDQWLLIPGITGVLAGISVGLDRLPPTLDQGFTDLSQSLVPSADRLFQFWSGMSPNHPSLSQLQSSTVAQQGILKPRTSNHLTFNSDYD